jgi:hypothetical protein
LFVKVAKRILRSDKLEHIRIATKSLEQACIRDPTHVGELITHLVRTHQIKALHELAAKLHDAGFETESNLARTFLYMPEKAE